MGRDGDTWDWNKREWGEIPGGDRVNRPTTVHT